LLDSLLRGTLAITQVHVLLITDAQNIQDQDSHISVPIVQIMNDFYRVTDPLSRPRIFALATAVKHGFHFDSAMLKLETTLNSKVFGVSAEKREEILALPDRPNEVVVLYEKPRQSAESRLFKQLHQLDPSHTIFRKHFRASQLALNEIGSCASDLIWRRALKDIEAVVQPWYEEEDETGHSSVPAIQRQIRDIVKNWTFMMPNLDASSWGFNVTPKFLKLVQTLKSCEPHGAGFRGIVFGKPGILL
jgi:endoribonuclease Dicer